MNVARQISVRSYEAVCDDRPFMIDSWRVYSGVDTSRVIFVNGHIFSCNLKPIFYPFNVSLHCPHALDTTWLARQPRGAVSRSGDERPSVLIDYRSGWHDFEVKVRQCAGKRNRRRLHLCTYDGRNRGLSRNFYCCCRRF